MQSAPAASAARIENAFPIRPIAGPPVHWPTASARRHPPDGVRAATPPAFVEMNAAALRYGGEECTLALDGTTLADARGVRRHALLADRGDRRHPHLRARVVESHCERRCRPRVRGQRP